MYPDYGSEPTESLADYLAAYIYIELIFPFMPSPLSMTTIVQYAHHRGLPVHHPLVNVFSFTKLKAVPERMITYGFYCIFLKETDCGNLAYGANYYDYQEGTLVFLAPGQLARVGSGKDAPPARGWGLLFSPDILNGTPLGANLTRYGFFGYQTNEALHLSAPERKLFRDCLRKIDYELRQPADAHSKTLIVDNIELLLNYCLRFYDRQFLTRAQVQSDVLTRFETLLEDYFSNGLAPQNGLPTVKYCARQLHFSSNYFGDLMKNLTGKSPQEHIHLKVINLAKLRVADPNRSIGEVAYELGFKTSQHFSKLFKEKVGVSPSGYRAGG